MAASGKIAAAEVTSWLQTAREWKAQIDERRTNLGLSGINVAPFDTIYDEHFTGKCPDPTEADFTQLQAAFDAIKKAVAKAADAPGSGDTYQADPELVEALQIRIAILESNQSLRDIKTDRLQQEASLTPKMHEVSTSLKHLSDLMTTYLTINTNENELRSLMSKLLKVYTRLSDVMAEHLKNGESVNQLLSVLQERVEDLSTCVVSLIKKVTDYDEETDDDSATAGTDSDGATDKTAGDSEKAKKAANAASTNVMQEALASQTATPASDKDKEHDEEAALK